MNMNDGSRLLQFFKCIFFRFNFFPPVFKALFFINIIIDETVLSLLNKMLQSRVHGWFYFMKCEQQREA